MKDFITILKREGDYNEKYINFTDRRFYFGSSYIEFFSCDSIGAALGSRRTILYVNECNHMSYNIVSELEQRTEETIFYDFNPTETFWIEDKIKIMPSSEWIEIKSTYKDNKYCPESIKREIELKAAIDPNYKRIHIDLEYGVYEGLIFPTFALVDSMPLVGRTLGLDFGFTNDPSGIVDVRFANGMLFIDEVLYATAMTNNDLIRFMRQDHLAIFRTKIVADSAEPKSIEEIKQGGFNIHPCQKGPDSIRLGIDKMKTYPICLTKTSTNLIKEFRSYHWATSKDGEILKDNNGKAFPADLNNHLIDPTRYVVMDTTLPKPSTRITRRRR